MSLLDIFRKEPQSLICPRCERDLDESHDEAACARKMSRRFFLGASAGVVVATALVGVAQSAALESAIVAPPPESWFPGAKYMISRDANGTVVTSLLSEKRAAQISSEVEYLRRNGFMVGLADAEHKLVSVLRAQGEMNYIRSKKEGKITTWS